MDFSKDSYDTLKTQGERIIRRSFVFWLVEIGFLIGLDQVIKQIVFSVFKDNILYKIFGIVLFKNSNFAFSIYMPPPLMYLLYAAAIISICIFLYKNFFLLKQLQVFAWSMILAGALSNVGERLLFGSVRDYLYIFSGIFNLADGYIIAGTIILLFVKNKKI